MLTRTTLCALIVSMAFSVQAKETVTVTGSTSASHIVEVLAETYSSENKETQIEVQGIGSSAGINAVKQNVADLGMSSRYLKPEEIKPDISTVTIAHDGIALVVHKENPVANLNKAQVEKIYHGEITNWNEVGGPDLKIAVVSRENASGSRFSFEDFMGLTQQIKGHTVSDINPQVLIVNTNGTVKSLVSRNKHALGYVSLGSVDDSIKALDFDGVSPSLENLESGKYKISRPFLMLYKEKQLNEDAQQFVDFVMSTSGQSLIEQRGYVSVIN
ncbi:phosphate ABC transporter substrate-binding protein [Photobacterium sp. DNB23_23_1]|uniref:Phosphate-binding protein n=1 Tax=Photobacterium pectinilyticum TaxID=2906793 RepID=A0ABT1MX92_9GAMM|nr:phosphate ABC transporter substrate-binding protein [Photobacterium sp. ZSDE20]MCQ1056974.1 phosphate ABC transporter substrate-binding protein [Photobacterium sp. ZSDE20]MDD1821109.1 phosphate ABC transporter substrate-binding protein [Photobacterium sp. ZSDE20]